MENATNNDEITSMLKKVYGDQEITDVSDDEKAFLALLHQDTLWNIAHLGHKWSSVGSCYWSAENLDTYKTELETFYKAGMSLYIAAAHGKAYPGYSTVKVMKAMIKLLNAVERTYSMYGWKYVDDRPEYIKKESPLAEEMPEHRHKYVALRFGISIAIGYLRTCLNMIYAFCSRQSGYKFEVDAAEDSANKCDCKIVQAPPQHHPRGSSDVHYEWIYRRNC